MPRPAPGRQARTDRRGPLRAVHLRRDRHRVRGRARASLTTSDPLTLYRASPITSSAPPAGSRSVGQAADAAAHLHRYLGIDRRRRRRATNARRPSGGRRLMHGSTDRPASAQSGTLAARKAITTTGSVTTAIVSWHSGVGARARWPPPGVSVPPANFVQVCSTPSSGTAHDHARSAHTEGARYWLQRRVRRCARRSPARHAGFCARKAPPWPSGAGLLPPDSRTIGLRLKGQARQLPGLDPRRFRHRRDLLVQLVVGALAARSNAPRPRVSRGWARGPTSPRTCSRRPSA